MAIHHKWTVYHACPITRAYQLNKSRGGCKSAIFNTRVEINDVSHRNADTGPGNRIVNPVRDQYSSLCFNGNTNLGLAKFIFTNPQRMMMMMMMMIDDFTTISVHMVG